MTDAFVALEAGDEHLTAPERAVGPVAEAVERERRRRARGAGARPCTPPRAHGGAARRAVGRSRSARELRRQVLRMQVVGDELGRHAVERGQVRDRLEERLVGRQVLEVAQVVTDHDLGPRVTATVHFSSPPTASTAREGAHGRRSGSGAYPRDRRSTCSRRGVARTTESSQRMWMGRSWVRNAVDEGTEARHGVVVGVGDRVVAAVAARHHQRARRRPAPGGDGGASTGGTARDREHRVRPTARSDHRSRRGADDDRPLRRRERLDRARVEVADRTGRVEVAHQHGEGLVVARLPASELAGPRARRRGHREVVPTDPLDPDDRAGREGRDRGVERVVAGRAAASPPRRARRRRGPHAGQALGWAWNRRSAGSSYSARHDGHMCEPGHGRRGPVVGHAGP